MAQILGLLIIKYLKFFGKENKYNYLVNHNY